VSRSEQAMWVEQWVGCAKNLNQWDMLEEYARDTHNHELSLDCLWRLQDWGALKTTLTNKVVQVRGAGAVLEVCSSAASEPSAPRVVCGGCRTEGGGTEDGAHHQL